LRNRLDFKQLESFVALADTGNYTRAAEVLNRTQPNISMQISRLEDKLDKTLVVRGPRQAELTEDGKILLAYARRILDLSAEAQQTLSMPELTGIVRVRIPEWFATDALQAMLCRFKLSHPRVKMAMHVGDSATLRAMLTDGQLDLALAIRDPDADPPPRIWREPLYWVSTNHHVPEPLDPVPLVLFVPPCPYRQVAADALAAIGRPWEEVFTSTSVAAVRVALNSGLGVSVLPAGAVSEGQRVLGPDDGFPDLPPTELSLYTAGAAVSLTVKSLSEFLAEHVGQAILKNTGVPAAVARRRRAG